MKKLYADEDTKIIFTRRNKKLDIALSIGRKYQTASITIETMKLDIWRKWCDALRSGNFKKCKNVLHNSLENSFCSLGILQNILDTYLDNWSTTSLSDKEMNLFAEPNLNLQLFFSTLNDTPKVETSFNLIADVIRVIIEMVQDDQPNVTKSFRFTGNKLY